MRKPSKSTLTRKLDKIVSEIVRSRGYCVRCSKTDNLQAAHIFSRTYRSTRWFLNNVVCLCASCHFFFHRNPILFGEWVKEWLGELNYTDLKIRANSIKKWDIDEMEALYEEFKKIARE